MAPITSESVDKGIFLILVSGLLLWQVGLIANVKLHFLIDEQMLLMIFTQSKMVVQTDIKCTDINNMTKHVGWMEIIILLIVNYKQNKE